MPDHVPAGIPSAISLSCDIVRAYVGHNAISQGDLPALIRSTHAAVLDLYAPAPAPAQKKEPAVPINRSITRDAIICLEDGLKFRSLKRHLWAEYRLTPDDYRRKWGLASDYPMVAPAYSDVRSQLAKKSGLGRRG